MSQKYFQQKVNTNINVFLDDIDKLLIGDIEICYKNNSPNDLNYIYFHLYPNAYKNNSTKFAQQQVDIFNNFEIFSRNYKKGFIDSLNFTVDEKSAELNYIDFDIAVLKLPQTLKSGDSIIIRTPFYVKIPQKKDRFGYFDDFYAITQWFPKPAVFDNNGWHPMSYLSNGEFYSEFGSYDVSITLPEKYIVAATGNLVTETELSKMKNFAETCKNTLNIKDIPAFGDKNKFKTIRFKEDNIHDFAWFASPNFLINYQEIEIKNKENSINCWVFYLKKVNLKTMWKNTIDILKKSVVFFSENIGEYPYNNCSIVEFSNNESGSGGMEYPTICLIENTYKEQTIVHEIAHNWFYGILASNERDNPWIDEGFTAFYENKYMDFFYPNLNFSENFIGKNWKIFGWNKLPARIKSEFMYNFLQHENLSQPSNLSTENQSLENYIINSYNKIPMAIYTLEEFLGQQTFKQLISDFYLKYKFQHIDTEIIKTFFTENTIKNIDWFFSDLIESNKISDYKIKRLKNDSIIIVNKGKTKIPLFLNIGDSLIIADGFEAEKKFALNNETEVVIDKNYKTIDNNRGNNFYSKGFFKKYKPIKFSLANIIDNPLVFEFPILPIPAYNYTDGFMVGMIFYSPPIPKKIFEYQIIPLWSFKNDNITGIANFSLYFHPKISIFREIELFSYFQSFSIDIKPTSYFKNSSGIKVKLKTDAKGQYDSEFLFRNICVTDYSENNYKNFQQLSYRYANNRFKNPYQYSATIENGTKYAKTFIEVENTLHYNYKDRGLRTRLFAGIFLYNNSDKGIYNFKMSGIAGPQDYLYDNLFLGRNEDYFTKMESFFAHQFVKNNGGFALFSPYGQSNKWLVALNFDSNTFIKTVDIFFNIASSLSDKVNFYYEGGIKLSFFRNFLNIYFPLFGSSNVFKYNDFYKKDYFLKVRFSLSLEKLNPLQYRDKPYYFR